MANGLSMKVLLQLQTKQFNQGINQVKKSLAGLKNTILGLAGALAGGLGFSKIVSEVKDTATKLSVAQATLKNVSDSTMEYAENLSFLEKISNQYGQDLLSNIKTFAQFRAAAKSSNLTLEEQRNIYESLTRAAGAYHLSASQSENMMLAVTQMMSKGKVASEELRRQLGNVLPGAFNLMTEAAYNAGVITKNSTAEMEKAMKKSAVTAEKVLPAFAQLLQKVTKSADFDSLQSSMNKFSNAWTNLVGKMNAAGIFKNIVDKGTQVFDWFGDNLNKVKHTAVGVLTAIVGFNIFNKLKAGWTNLRKESDIYFRDLYNQSVKLEKQITKITKESRNPRVQQGKGGVKMSQSDLGGVIGDITKNGPEAAMEISKINHKYMELYETNKKLGKNSWIKAHAQDYDLIKRQTAEIDNELIRVDALTEEAFVGTTKWGRAAQFVKGVVQQIGATLMAMGIAALVGAIVGGVTSIVSRIKEAKAELERINSIHTEFEHGIKGVKANVDDTKKSLQKQLDIIKKEGKQSDAAKAALKEINKELGRTGNNQLKIEDGYGKITSAVDKYIESVQRLSMIQYYVDRQTEASAKKRELIMSQAAAKERLAAKGLYQEDESGWSVNRSIWGALWNKKDNQDFEIIRNADKELEGLNSTIDDCKKALEELKYTEGELDGNKADNGSGSDTKKMQKALDKYKESVEGLKNKLKEGVVSQKGYEKELLKTQAKTWETILGMEDYEDKLKELGPAYANLARELKEGWNLNDALEEEKEYFDNAEKEAIEGIEEQIKQIEKYQKKLHDILKDDPKKGNVDDFFNYKKSDSDIFDAQADSQEEYVEDLEDFRDKLLELKEDFGKLDPAGQAMLDHVIIKLREAGASAKDLRDKANIAEWIEDVKELKKELDDAKYDSFKDLAESFDRLVRGSKNLAEAWATLSDTEISEETKSFFDKLEAGLSILNEGIQMFETMKTIVEGLKKVEEAEAALKLATSAQDKIDMAAKLGLLKAEEAEQKKSAITAVSAESTKQAAAASTTTALGAEAVAGAASSQSAIPIVGPLLAAAAVAAIVALLAANMKKFANGGLVGGSSTYGDHNVVRANSGEMILNKSQQGTLYDAIASGKLGGNQGEWKVRGTDLIKVINNTNAKINGK